MVSHETLVTSRAVRASRHHEYRICTPPLSACSYQSRVRKGFPLGGIVRGVIRSWGLEDTVEFAEQDGAVLTFTQSATLPIRVFWRPAIGGCGHVGVPGRTLTGTALHLTRDHILIFWTDGQAVGLRESRCKCVSSPLILDGMA